MMQGPEHLPAYKPGGRLETFDIEELVAEGKAGYAALLSSAHLSPATFPWLDVNPSQARSSAKLGSLQQCKYCLPSICLNLLPPLNNVNHLLTCLSR